MKKVLIVIAGLFVLVLGSVAGLMALGTSRLNATMMLQPESLRVPTDAVTIAKGERLAAIYQCSECHGENLAGMEFIASDAFMHLTAPNLTSGIGGMASFYNAAEWEHAIRHGVGHNGRQLLIMPSQMFSTLTDADVAAIIAYIQSAPAVNSQLAERRFGPIGRLVAALKADELIAARQIDHEMVHPEDVDTTDTAKLGAYLSQGCTLCHGQDFAGGPLEFAPDVLVANLTPDPETGLGDWTLTDFTRVLREGKSRDGRELDPNMPWRGYAHYTDAEIAALWRYLQSLPRVHTDRRSND